MENDKKFVVRQTLRINENDPGTTLETDLLTMKEARKIYDELCEKHSATRAILLIRRE